LPEFSRRNRRELSTKRSVTATLFTFDWLGTRSLSSLGGARSPSNTHTTTPTARKMNSQSGARGPSDAERAAMSYDHRSQVRYVGEDFNASPGPNTSLWSRIKAKAPKIGSKSAVSQPCFSACHTHTPPVSPLLASRRNTEAHPTGVVWLCGMCAAESHNVFVVGLRGATGDVRRRLCHTGQATASMSSSPTINDCLSRSIDVQCACDACGAWRASQLTHISFVPALTLKFTHMHLSL
jgi:hypothetical protein